MDIETNREEGKDNQMDDENRIGEDFYYDEKELEKRVKVSVIVDDVCRFKSLFGFDSEKRNNFKFLSEKEIVYSSGTSYMLLDLEKEKTRILHSRDGGGIGCIAVHPESDYIAVAEKGDNPNIYVYDYPDLNLYRILKKGAEKSYSHIVFSFDGNTLASVSNSPDFLLSIWDWKK